MNKFLSGILNRIAEREFRITNLTCNDAPLFESLTLSDKDAPVAIIYGENASGKSLFATIIEMAARDEKIACRASCMRNRTSGGIERAMVFGNESEQSTGATSVKVANSAMLHSFKEEGAAIAILDEPDVGLSDHYSPAMGQHIAEQINAADENKGLVLVSHSKLLIRQFIEVYNKPISTLGINTDLDLDEWLGSDTSATVEELLDMVENASDKNIAIIRGIKD